MIFSLGAQQFKIDPVIEEDMFLFGEDYRGQSGTGYRTLNGEKIFFQVTFPRLDRDEATALKQMSRPPENSPYSELILVDRDRIFDGATQSAEYGRILNKVKITSAKFTPVVGHYDDSINNNQSLESASITLEEV